MYNMKTHTTLTVDAEVIEKARAIGINISGEFNDFLINRFNQKTENIEGINIQIERKTLEKAQKEANKLAIIIRNCQENIQRWEEMKEKKDQEVLQKEKDRIEANKKCQNCGSILEGKKSFMFGNGAVCNSCYMAASSSDVEKWNKRN